jgi:hypothetical protein
MKATGRRFGSSIGMRRRASDGGSGCGGGCFSLRKMAIQERAAMG